MATLQELKAAIDRVLNIGASRPLLTLRSNTCERAYEAYVFALCADAVRRAGGTAVVTGISSGANPSVLVFRGGPGSLASSYQDYCYVDCGLNGRQFELHVDVTFEGQSGANHEIDVSIVDKSHADDVRRFNRLPRTNKHLIGAIECKFYQSRPGVVLARTFVGLVRDCSSNRFDGFIANRTTDELEAFLSTSWSPQPFTDLLPLNPDAEDRFVRSLEQVLRKWSPGR